MTKIMLTVRTRSVAEDVISQLQDLPVEFFAATAVTEAQDILTREHLDHAILGGGLDLDSRLAIVRAVFESSDSTTVHMNSPSGPETYLPFVRSVLQGLLAG